MNNHAYEIFIRNANGDVEYIKCNSQNNMDLYIQEPYLGVVATNVEDVNDIDILGIYVNNQDQNQY